MSQNAIADTFGQFASALPEVERTTRRANLERFLVSGFPDADLEDWRYTDLSALDERAFALAGTASFDSSGSWLEDADRLVYINGQLDTAASTTVQWHAADVPAASDADGILALNAAFATGGLRLSLARGQRLERPLQLLLVSSGSADAATMSHQRHRISLAEQAEATVLLHAIGSDGERLSSQVVEIELAAGAALTLYRLQAEASGGSLVTRITVRQGRDSRFKALTLDVGAGLARHDLDADLAEPGADCEVSGLYMPQRGAHVDNHTRSTHIAARCRSRSHYRGIIDERAKAVFNGKVIVRPGAQKTDSEQRIANLLLSRKAEVNAKPELEIYADDVKCAHGSTVGQLDETALAYLRSRGIARDVARALLLRAFATEVLDRIEWPALRRHVETLLHLPTELPETLGE